MYVGISKKPDDPKEQKQWIESMKRIQIGMWIDDKATCEHCSHIYNSVDDFIRCDPRQGKTKGKLSFVCSGCWDEYDKVTSHFGNSVGMKNDS